MNDGNLYERTAVRIKHDVCSFSLAAKFPASLVQVPFVKFRQCEDYSEQLKSYFEPLTLAWPRCVYLNLSVLLAYIFIIINLTILGTRLSVFVQLLLN